MAGEPRLAMLVQSASHNRLHAMVSLTATTVALGGEAHLFLTHEALKAFLSGTLDEARPSFHDPEYQAYYEEAIELERTPNLTDLLAQARARGKVHIYGCQASVALWRRYTTEQIEQLTAVIGHSTFLSLARDMQLIFL